jgi:acetolactate synthase-1/3 small subunit
LEQITKQLHKLIDTLKVFDYLDTPMLERELALVKVNAEPGQRLELMQLIEIFRGKVIDVAEKTFVIEVTGSGDKIDAFEKQMEAFGIRELVRTGRIAMMRGPRTV